MLDDGALVADKVKEFSAAFEEHLEGMDKGRFDTALRLALRCLIYEGKSRRSDKKNVLACILKYQAEDTLLAQPTESEGFARIVCFHDKSYNSRMFKVCACIY